MKSIVFFLGDNAIKQYIWRGLTKHGKRTQGKLIAPNQEAIYAELSRLNIIPIKIRPVPSWQSFARRINTADVVLFTRQLATLISAGISLVPALEISAKTQHNFSFGTLIDTVRNHVAAGETLQSALAMHPQYFNRLYCNIVAAGEKSGALALLLQNLASYLEKSLSLKKRIQKALYYPIVILSSGLLVGLLLLFFVMPQFEIFFSSYGGKLPYPTQFLLLISSQLQQHWCLNLTLIALLSFSIFYLVKHHPKIHFILDKLWLKLPLLGPIILKTIVIRTCMTLTTLLESGVPMIEALASVASISNNHYYLHAMHHIQEEMSTGQPFHIAMKLNPFFPGVVIHMIAISEQTDTLNTMLTKIANYYTETLDNDLNTLTALIEPAMMLLLGLVIGYFILAIYLPIFRLGTLL